MTPKQKQVFETIRRLLAENGVSPSYREIAYACGYKSTSRVSGHIAALRRDGLLTGTPRASRSLRVVEPTLRPDLAAAVAGFARERGISERQVINEAVAEYFAGYPAKAVASS